MLHSLISLDGKREVPAFPLDRFILQTRYCIRLLRSPSFNPFQPSGWQMPLAWEENRLCIHHAWIKTLSSTKLRDPDWLYAIKIQFHLSLPLPRRIFDILNRKKFSRKYSLNSNIAAAFCQLNVKRLNKYR